VRDQENVYILVVEAIERQKTGVEYAEINGITLRYMVLNLTTTPKVIILSRFD
jgi:hypothetical protein